MRYDETDTFSLVLHPGLKLDYFRVQEWEEKWIDTAENLVREEYISEYEDRASVDDDDMADEASNSLIFSAKFNHVCKQGSDDDGFGNISVGKKVPKRSEIDVYLSLAVENVKDPLKWWVDNRQAYPNLSRMARDYLSIPGKLILSLSRGS